VRLREAAVADQLNAADLLPANPNDAARWSFEGSLTTPPCTEPVQWTVFRQPVEMSKGQIGKLTSVYEGNVRPVQPLNGRQVLFGR
jgi:carbonic anhydrase